MNRQEQDKFLCILQRIDHAEEFIAKAILSTDLPNNSPDYVSRMKLIRFVEEEVGPLLGLVKNLEGKEANNRG